MSKSKKKKIDRSPDISWNIVPFDFDGFMTICRTLMILGVFVISSYQWGYTGDLLWQCVWCLSLIKVVELSDE